MKYIVVHSGARDGYKLAEVLYKNGKLGFLVTDDIFFRKKYRNLFPYIKVKISYKCLLGELIIRLFHLKNTERIRQAGNRYLGIKAGKLSKKYNMPLIALQEYAYHAFKFSDVHPRVVFQYHPQSNANKKIFEEEIKRHPESVSFKKEISIYTQKKLKEASDELQAADFFIGASSFTKQTLVENGALSSNVFVAPYGVDISKYPYKVRQVPEVVTFVFVGSFVERKGIYYLLNAAKRLEDEGFRFNLQLTGRVSADTTIFDAYNLKNLTVHSNLSHDELIHLLHTSDVFVFPSLFEGFAFVIVEAMATGLPVITTPRTVGPDVINNGDEGFIIEPSNVVALYEKMKWFILHPEKCPEMGRRSNKRSKELTWDNFENKIIEAVDIIEQKSV